jgi:hypothetical protein
MTRRFSGLTIRLTGLVLLLSVALIVTAATALRAGAKVTASAGASKAFSVDIVNHDFGSVGAKGSFSVKLGPAAHVVAALMSAVNGLPYTQIAEGGTFVAKDTASGKGRLAVVKFADHALGTICVQWSATAGPYDSSKGYLVAKGSMTIIGGTGAAAHWSGQLTFKQTGVTGTDTLVFNALAAAATGRARGLTAACKAVSKLAG